MRTSMIALSAAGLLAMGATVAATAAGLPAVVRKDSVTAFSAPDFDASAVATLDRGDKVQVADQNGLWYQLSLDGGASGFVRVNEIRIAQTSATGSEDTMQILMTGKSGRGRITETAGVRGLDESQLRSASFDAGQLARMQGYRASPQAAAAYARQHDWPDTRVAWEGEAGPVGVSVAQAESRETSHKATRLVGGLFGALGNALDSVLDVSEKAAPKAEAELLEVELELGPMIAGRVLGARPLWDNSQAQTRVNLIGRWLASQTSRPDLPWTFGVIDSPEYNAFAAPGGYVMVTRGLYQLAESDAELAAVLAHEITHIVQRDHYAVIRDQGVMSTGLAEIGSQITGGGFAEDLALNYVKKHGASILVTSLDRNAEYRADAIAQVYLARAGMNPLGLYAILQKMSAMGSPDGGLAQLYATHPSIDDRLDRIDRRGYPVLSPYLDRRISTR